MTKKNIVYIGSLRNAAADKAGQYIEYKNEKRYMKSPIEYMVEMLNTTELGDVYHLKGIIFDDDENLASDREKVSEYGFSANTAKRWFYPKDLEIHGQKLTGITYCVPSSYRKHPFNSDERTEGKSDFERRLKDKLDALEADVVILDGLLIILDELVRPNSSYYRKIVNIHPGITQEDSPYQRRGAYATLDSLYGAKGLKVVNWETKEKTEVEPIYMTGASFHYVDNGIDSGEVIADVLATEIDPKDNILELRWNNFTNSLFPAIYKGFAALANLQK